MYCGAWARSRIPPGVIVVSWTVELLSAYDFQRPFTSNTEWALVDTNAQGRASSALLPGQAQEESVAPKSTLEHYTGRCQQITINHAGPADDAARQARRDGRAGDDARPLPALPAHPHLRTARLAGPVDVCARARDPADV